jgi:hypothetical protein
MTLKLKALLEGYAWERKADGSLPTLRDAIAVHEANKAKKDINEYGATPSKENWKGWFVLNANLRGDTTNWKKGELIKAYKSADSDHIYVVTGDANYDASDEWAQSDFDRIAEPLNAEKHKKSYNYVKKLEKSNQLKPWEIMTPRWQDSDGDGKWYEPGQDVAKSINEYGEDEFDRDPQMYGGGKSSREYAGIPSELVEQIEDHVERLMQDLSTNSNVPTSEKSVILKQLVKISDLIDQLQDEL